MGYDVDLHIYDASGNHSGHVERISTVLEIPNASYTADGQISGPTLTETFRDNSFFVAAPSLNRPFGYVVCFYGHVQATLIAIDRNGTSHTSTFDGHFGNAWRPAIPGDTAALPNGTAC